MTTGVEVGERPLWRELRTAAVVGALVLVFALLLPSWETGEDRPAVGRTTLPPLSPADEAPAPRTVAVSPDGQFVVRTVFPDRPRPLRADVEMVAAGTGEVLWRQDLRDFPARNFTTGAWFGSRVALPRGRLANSTEPEDNITLIEFRGRQAALVYHWAVRPFGSGGATIRDVRFESADVVAATIVPDNGYLASIGVRCTVGQPTCVRTR